MCAALAAGVLSFSPQPGGSAATPRPVHIRFKKTPSATELHQAIDQQLPPGSWFNDVHGSAPYKRHVTFYLAEQIRAELS